MATRCCPEGFLSCVVLIQGSHWQRTVSVRFNECEEPYEEGRKEVSDPSYLKTLLEGRFKHIHL